MYTINTALNPIYIETDLERSFATNSNFVMPICSQPDGVNL